MDPQWVQARDVHPGDVIRDHEGVDRQVLSIELGNGKLVESLESLRSGGKVLSTGLVIDEDDALFFVLVNGGTVRHEATKVIQVRRKE